jgi:hypothetical protein
MYVLSALIAQSEQQGQTAQAEDLKEVQQLIMDEAERQVPPQIRIINRLLRAESDAEQREILDQNPEMLTPELVQMLNALASEVAEDGQDSDMEERIQKLRAMVEMRI